MGNARQDAGLDDGDDGALEILAPMGGAPKGGDDIEVVIAGAGDDSGDDDQTTGDPAAGDDNLDDDTAGDDPPAGDPPPDDEGDDTRYGKNVRGRIQREVRLRREAEERLDSERIARGVAEDRVRKANTALVSVTLGSLDMRIRDASARLVAAKEAGETAKEVEVQTELSDLQAQKRDAEQVKRRLEDEAEAMKSGGGSGSAVNNPLTARWMGRNKWFNDPKFAAAAAVVRAIDADLSTNKGMRPDSEAYFVELDKRLHQEMPTLRSRIRAAGFNQPAPRSGGLPPRGGGNPAPRNGGGNRQRVVLTHDDLENMARFGMDPDSKDDRVAYARNKIGAN